MTYNVIVLKKVQKELNKLNSKIYARIYAALEGIAANPFIGKNLAGEYAHLWSHRVWPYRIIYDIQQKELIVLVVKVGHRQGVYK